MTYGGAGLFVKHQLERNRGGQSHTIPSNRRQELSMVKGKLSMAIHSVSKLSNDCKLSRTVWVWGWVAPNLASQILRARWKNGRASANCPIELSR